MDLESDLVDNIRACRTCGIHYVNPSKHQLKHLFQSCQEHSEVMLIRLELAQWNIEVTENDGFPQYVCNTCIHKFEQVFQLRAACVNAQNEFRKFYALPNGNIPVINIKTEILDPDLAAPPACDFIYVDDLSDGEYDSVTPFNFLHIPIKEEVFEAATIPKEESQQPTKFVESACGVLMQTEARSSQISEVCSQNESIIDNQTATVAQMDTNELKCKLCPYVSYNQQEYKSHMKDAHDIKDFECHICGKEFTNSSEYRIKFHMKWHTLSKQVKCTLCGFVCNSKDVLREHKRLYHRKSNCKVCGKGIFAKKMKSHLRQHKLNSKFCCEYCTEAFSTDSERENHIWDVHANEDTTAANSVGTFQTISANSPNIAKETLYHEQQDHMIFKYMCVHCEHRFIDHIDLETHVNDEHCGRLTTIESQNLGLKGPCEITQNKTDQQTDVSVFGDYDNNNEMHVLAHNNDQQTDVSVFEDYDNNNEMHVLAHNNDSTNNNAPALRHEYSLPTSSPFLLNQNETVITGSSTYLSSVNEPNNEESENETHCHLSQYIGNNLNTFVCANCSDIFVNIEQLRQHHEQHLLADQQKLNTTHSKLKFNCPFCVKSFDLKFSLNRHLKKHKSSPF